LAERLLEGRVAIVSGVGPGVGEAIAETLAAHGAAVALAARSGDRLEAVKGRIEAAGGRALAHPTDVTDAGQVAALVAATTEAFGRLDVLVSNAVAYAPYHRIEESPVEEWRPVLEVNLLGTITACQTAIPAMRASGGGSIVVVSSQVARTHYAGMKPQGAYAASKGALLVTAMHLAGEVGVDGIRVNSVVPGWIWGPRVQERFEREARERGVSADAVYAEMAERMALHRLPRPEDIANAVLFFASDLSGAVTGQSLDVNGGEYFH
jgi:NAD(P)-dependent dehydrogenase (short-subunit alcohol dehydrogenase family)